MDDFLLYITISLFGLIFGWMITFLRKNLQKEHSSNFINQSTIDECLAHVEEDYLPFNDVYRAIYGYDKTQPSKTEIENTFQLFSYLVREEGLVPVFGTELKPSGRTVEEDLEYIHKKLMDKKYEDYNYGVWLSLAE
ncbi:MAG: hypothetical protein HWD92_06315 [Flavobacteriia bacterium]|nr:hypothetical protein [Flavobacteriia bacterium]